MSHANNEPFAARWYAIVNCEASDCSFEEAIVVSFPREDRANCELARRQALSVDDDDYADGFHAVLPVHVDAVGWNSLEPLPGGWPGTGDA